MRGIIYDRRFRWRPWSQVKENVYGEEENTWMASEESPLWCAVEELTADEQLIFGGKFGAADVKIRVNNYVPIAARDGLLDTRFGDIYYVTGVLRGDNEMIAYSTRAKDVQHMFG